jgi:hypothetical protein
MPRPLLTYVAIVARAARSRPTGKRGGDGWRPGRQVGRASGKGAGQTRLTPLRGVALILTSLVTIQAAMV